jgi:transcriptional regulator NrdR family protein
MPLYVIKSDKTKEEYKEEKVISALKRAKVSEKDIEKILKKN